MDESITISRPVEERSKSRSKNLFTRFLTELPFGVGSIPFLWQILFFVIPLCLIIGLSVVEFDQIGNVSNISFNSFKQVLSPQYFYIIHNSLKLASLTTILCLVLGLPLAYCMAFHSGRFKQLLLFLLIIPFWTNFILHIYAWFFVLEKNGFLNNVLISSGIISEPLHALNTYFAVLLMMVYFYLPFMVLPLYSSLERFDGKLLEASLDLGANKIQTIFRILLPALKKAIKAGIFLVFIPSFGEFVIPELMGGDKVAYVGNVISLYVLDQSSQTLGIAFTIVSALLLIASLITLNFGIEKLAKRLAGGEK